jgi:hypothetical protein
MTLARLPNVVFCVVGTPAMLTTGSNVVTDKLALPISVSCVILICVAIFIS